jgi:hypothetical protein
MDVTLVTFVALIAFVAWVAWVALPCAPSWAGRFAFDDIAEARVAIDAPSHIADALIAERMSASNAERGVRSFCMVKTVHYEISLSWSIRV